MKTHPNYKPAPRIPNTMSAAKAFTDRVYHFQNILSALTNLPNCPSNLSPETSRTVEKVNDESAVSKRPDRRKMSTRRRITGHSPDLGRPWSLGGLAPRVISLLVLPRVVKKSSHICVYPLEGGYIYINGKQSSPLYVSSRLTYASYPISITRLEVPMHKRRSLLDQSCRQPDQERLRSRCQPWHNHVSRRSRRHRSPVGDGRAKHKLQNL